MSPSFLVPPLPHQEGMIKQPELGRPSERRDKVPRDHTRHRPSPPHGPSWIGEGDPGLFDQHNRNWSTRDMCHAPLKEVCEEDAP